MSTRLLLYALGLPCTALLISRVSSMRLRQSILLVASLAFYLSLGGALVAVLLCSSLVNYALGLRLRRSPTLPWLWLGIGFNVGLLCFFKYLPGFAAQVAAQGFLARIALPVGLSFWTFQALSYLFDLYREEDLDPTLLEFCLYMSFAPTVLSGPICRLPDILPQLRRYVPPSRSDRHVAAQRIWLGALMIGLAQWLGSGVRTGHGIDAGFDATGILGGADVWLLAIGYGFQLFLDFAGYSHLAIGAALWLGVRATENFDRPYLSSSPSVFWTRWHMSLSFWIRDYLFLPLAALSRRPWTRQAVLLLSMIVFGLWHKGSLLFVLWGAYHGLLLVLHRQWQQLQRRLNFRWEGRAQSAISWLLTFASICLGWIFFRARDLKQVRSMLGALVSPLGYRHTALPSDLYALTAVLVVGYFVLAAFRPEESEGRTALSKIPLELRYVVYAAALYLVVFRAAQPQAFIYSQF
jgi:alginate O-acetyltransferase complex protein AlgI